MKQYTVFYEHKKYGYYTARIEGDMAINDALDYFIINYSYIKVYGIMETN